MSLLVPDLIAFTLCGNGQSDPGAGFVSWALQKQFESICRQFASTLENNVQDFNRADFIEKCGLPKESA